MHGAAPATGIWRREPGVEAASGARDVNLGIPRGRYRGSGARFRTRSPGRLLSLEDPGAKLGKAAAKKIQGVIRHSRGEGLLEEL